MQYSFDMKVLGGLPVTVEFTLLDGEFLDWNVTHISGKKVRFCDWLIRRDEVVTEIEDACYAYLNDL